MDDIERERLALADRHIAETEARIAAQDARLAAMDPAGDHATVAEELLAVMRQSLAAMHHHRRLILEAIDRKCQDAG